MSFTAKDVQSLREQTGAGMMDCKKALTASEGDFQKAIEFLREKGIAAAVKKAGRIAAEGIVFATVSDEGVGAVVEINSETDFVAKNEDFREFASNIAGIVADTAPADVDALMAAAYAGGMSVADALREKVLTIGENIQIRRFERYDADALNASYIHMGGKIGVLARFKVSDNLRDSDDVRELSHDICMQIAAMRPQYLRRDQVPAGDLEKEKEILLAQALNEGKPAAVAEKIVAGRISKFYEEICLLDQAFVKENKVSVGKYVELKAKALGGQIEIEKFVRFEKGEGLAKREDNFAQEVAKAAKQ